MACGICGSAGHNRRTHAEHEEPQDQALLEGPQHHSFEDPTGQTVVRANVEPTDVQHPTFLVGEQGPVMGHMVDGVWTPVTSAGQWPDPERCAACEVRLTDGESFLCSDCVDAPPVVPADDESADWSDDDEPDLDPEAINDGDHTGELIDVEPLDHESADFTVPRCQECGEPLDDGQSSLCGSCAVQDQHKCEPLSALVSYCRYCGINLMVEEPVLLDTSEPRINPPWRTVLGPDEPIRITQPGVYELDANEYHDPAITGDWLSNSDARQLIDPGTPAQFRYDRDNGVRKTSEAFSMGHAVHAAILGKGETIAVRPLVNPENPEEEWGDWRKNSAKKWRAEQEAAGRSVILPEHAEIVEAMAAAVHLKPRAHELLSQPGRPEVALFWVDPVTGVKRRALVDYLPDGPGPDGVMRPVDIKSADEVAPNASMEKKLYDHCWHRQAVTIADGIRALGLADEVEFYFIVQSKRPPHLVTVVTLDADAERIGGIENQRSIMVYKECMETGVWPDYVHNAVTMTVPAWISRIYEDEMEIS